MITPHDERTDLRRENALHQLRWHQEVVDPPASVELPLLRNLLIPECVGLLRVRVHLSKAVHPTRLQERVEVHPLIIQEARARIPILHRFLDVNVSMSNIEVPAYYGRLALVQALHVLTECGIPLRYPMGVPLSPWPLAVGCVHCHQDPTPELQCRRPPLHIELRWLNLSHRLILSPDRCPTEPLPLSNSLATPPVPMGIHARESLRDVHLALLSLGLLEAHDVPLALCQEVQRSSLQAGSDARNVPA